VVSDGVFHLDEGACALRGEAEDADVLGGVVGDDVEADDVLGGRRDVGEGESEDGVDVRKVVEEACDVGHVGGGVSAVVSVAEDVETGAGPEDGFGGRGEGGLILDAVGEGDFGGSALEDVGDHFAGEAEGVGLGGGLGAVFEQELRDGVVFDSDAGGLEEVEGGGVDLFGGGHWVPADGN
jgi:hypothetical protein